MSSERPGSREAVRPPDHSEVPCELFRTDRISSRKRLTLTINVLASYDIGTIALQRPAKPNTECALIWYGKFAR